MKRRLGLLDVTSLSKMLARIIYYVFKNMHRLGQPTRTSGEAALPAESIKSLGMLHLTVEKFGQVQ